MDLFNRNTHRFECDESYEDFKVNKIDHNPLKFDKIYALKILTTNPRIYRGIYIGSFRDKYGYIICKFRDIMDKQLSEIRTSHFSREYTFYDVEEIRENGKKARQNMEQRALNIVLKRLVNETFEWS
jgi:hypothetical protein